MDGKENISDSSPSLIQKNTPIRRVGLSRKRKSCTPEIHANKLQSKISYQSPVNSIVQLNPVECEDEGKEESSRTNGSDSANNKCDSGEVMASKKRCMSTCEKPKVSNETSISEIVTCEIEELENLHQVWKNGCKEAMLHLLALLKDKQPEFNSVEKVSLKLGIWDTIQNTFENDPEFLSYEE